MDSVNTHKIGSQLAIGIYIFQIPNIIFFAQYRVDEMWRFGGMVEKWRVERPVVLAQIPRQLKKCVAIGPTDKS
jgi:hypothetical protein